MLGFFWALASLDHEEREAAARGLVEELAAAQAQFEADESAEEEGGAGNTSGEEEEAEETVAKGGTGTKQGPRLRGCCPLLVYALRRLCRGLGSSRQGARQGFALALAALLAQLEQLDTRDAQAVMDEVLEPVGKVKGGGCLAHAWHGRKRAFPQPHPPPPPPPTPPPSHTSTPPHTHTHTHTTTTTTNRFRGATFGMCCWDRSLASRHWCAAAGRWRRVRQPRWPDSYWRRPGRKPSAKSWPVRPGWENGG